jgi:hypothetical protein
MRRDSVPDIPLAIDVHDPRVIALFNDRVRQTILTIEQLNEAMLRFGVAARDARRIVYKYQRTRVKRRARARMRSRGYVAHGRHR